MSRGQPTELVSINYPLTTFPRGISPRFAYFTCHFSGATLLWALLFQEGKGDCGDRGDRGGQGDRGGLGDSECTASLAGL